MQNLQLSSSKNDKWQYMSKAGQIVLTLAQMGQNSINSICLKCKFRAMIGIMRRKPLLTGKGKEVTVSKNQHRGWPVAYRSFGFGVMQSVVNQG